MKKAILAGYAGYFLGVFATGALGWWLWVKYGREMSDTDATVVTGNNGHHSADLVGRRG